MAYEMYTKCVLCDVGIKVFSIIYITATLDGVNNYAEEISVVTPVKDTRDSNFVCSNVTNIMRL
jgi:hypothetical protein